MARKKADPMQEKLYDILFVVGRVFRKIGFVLLLICCFPVGLYLLWRRENRIPLIARALITACIAAVMVSAVVIGMPDDPYERGGIEIVRVTPNAEVYGPEIPEAVQGAAEYANAYSAESIILLPTATPVPIYVYCNDNGKHYHLESCHYVKENTPKVTLTQALTAGFTPCSECKPPIS